MVLDKLAAIERRYEELLQTMADPAVATDPARLADLAREQADLAEVVALYREHQAVERELADARQLAGDGADPELAELAQLEIERLDRKSVV